MTPRCQPLIRRPATSIKRSKTSKLQILQSTSYRPKRPLQKISLAKRSSISNKP